MMAELNPFVPSEVEGRCATCLDFARHERIKVILNYVISL